MEITYIPPIGEELQHEKTKSTLLFHSDLYLLLNMQNLAVGDRMAESVLDRCNKAIDASNKQSVLSFDDALRDAAPEVFESDTLNDLGRYSQGLNAQKRKVEEKLAKLDAYREKLKTDKEKVQLDKINKGLRNYLSIMYSDVED